MASTTARVVTGKEDLPFRVTHQLVCGWQKPKGIRVVAVIFYGRRRNVDMLDCYLQQNLARNGGYLDEVRFLIHTNNKNDISFLYQLASLNPDYRMVHPGSCQGNDYGCLWEDMVEDNTIYIKIDDDIAYIHHDAIPQLIHTRIKVQHPLWISANLVNAPVTGLEHFHFGALHPFLPELAEEPIYSAVETWRPSEDPLYPVQKTLNVKYDNDIIFQPVPYPGHRWLLLEGDGSFNLLKTPIGINFGRNAGLHDLYITAWKTWTIGAQQHYSLLRNLELNKAAVYFFGAQIGYNTVTTDGTSESPTASKKEKNAAAGATATPGEEQLFDTQYKRFNVIFAAFWGHDMRQILPLGDDDELAMTLYKPRELRRPVVVDTRSLVAHFSFGTREGIYASDLLDRWRAFANEMVCTVENQKLPWNGRCPGF